VPCVFPKGLNLDRSGATLCHEIVRSAPIPRFAFLLAGALALPAPALEAQRRGPSERYLRLVDSYAADPQGAITALSGWGIGELKDEIGAIVALARNAEACGRRGPRAELLAGSACAAVWNSFQSLPLRAALLLHAQRDVSERPFEMQGEVVAQHCGLRIHDGAARSLAGLLLQQQPHAEEFARRFYLAMALRSHRDLCFEDGRYWAGAGVSRFPRDAALWLALGTAEEIAELRSTPAPLSPLTRDAQPGAVSLGAHRDLLERARRALEQALLAEPGLDEARLRLGNVLWRLGRNGAAEAFQEVLRVSRDPWTRHLGHLFLGRCRERAGRLREAASEYRSALAEAPESETAGVALAYVLELQGERVAAQAVVVRALGDGRRSSDAYRKYLVGQYPSAEALWNQLRNEVQP